MTSEALKALGFLFESVFRYNADNKTTRGFLFHNKIYQKDTNE